MWSQTYGGPATEICLSAIEAIDGGTAMVGYTYSFGSGDADVWLVKTDLHGNMEWNKTFGTGNYEAGQHLVATDDGGYIIAGSTSSFGQGENDFWLIKTDEFGVVPEYFSWPLLSLLLISILGIVIFKKRLFNQPSRI